MDSAAAGVAYSESMVRPVFDFLLLPEFSFIGFAALVEPLRIANRFQPGAYRWRMV